MNNIKIRFKDNNFPVCCYSCRINKKCKSAGLMRGCVTGKWKLRKTYESGILKVDQRELQGAIRIPKVSQKIKNTINSRLKWNKLPLRSDYIVMDDIIKDIKREIELRERYLEDSRKEMRRVNSEIKTAAERRHYGR
jgi:hypothetical protein